MKIKWFGQSCFLITAENGTRIVTDPYENMLGYKLPVPLEAELVTTSHNHRDHNHVGAVCGDFEHIRDPGHFTAAGIELTGVETFHDNVSGAKRGKNIVYNLTIDGLRVCHCGDLGHLLSPEQLAAVGKADILMVPVGGGRALTLDARRAAEVMRQLRPAVVVPMHYRTKAMGPLGLAFGKVGDFIAASGMEATKYDILDVGPSNLREHAGVAVLRYD
ncbi:L-ascorbate metabolism protein UlaG, beta-lactamase superfamily [Sporobacter termitidis DSM 10068]|uniref:L-ascorbate metabolism protein UlaG, beta-lactamase superfamily n=1 Tax=Sporobacter termitidis DSM 10068 TaxID=1123282 RepID=A0A1M5XSK2_9FIRM|nr:MBL fold metallo-hydrolase [Sporobacter termitidis]SHI02504.1 L-ascorbate metabolism protein UlaG, beta-lactamase superfamily [Sporobacter termitidis DSM 10068]